MRICLALIVLLSSLAQADQSPLRPSARLLLGQTDLRQAGRCVVYQEGGSGLVMTEPVYYLRGEVLAAAVEVRHLGVCPLVPGKSFAQYNRAEFNRQALAYPCVSPGVPERDEQIGVVRLRLTDWETPHSKKAENAGRLYRGKFLDRTLEKNMEIELEADLLGFCTP